MKQLPKRNGNTSEHFSRRSPEQRYIRQEAARRLAAMGFKRPKRKNLTETNQESP